MATINPQFPRVYEQNQQPSTENQQQILAGFEVLVNGRAVQAYLVRNDVQRIWQNRQPVTPNSHREPSLRHSVRVTREGIQIFLDAESTKSITKPSSATDHNAASEASSSIIPSANLPARIMPFVASVCVALQHTLNTLRVNASSERRQLHETEHAPLNRKRRRSESSSINKNQVTTIIISEKQKKRSASAIKKAKKSKTEEIEVSNLKYQLLTSKKKKNDH